MQERGRQGSACPEEQQTWPFRSREDSDSQSGNDAVQCGHSMACASMQPLLDACVLCDGSSVIDSLHGIHANTSSRCASTACRIHMLPPRHCHNCPVSHPAKISCLRAEWSAPTACARPGAHTLWLPATAPVAPSPPAGWVQGSAHPPTPASHASSLSGQHPQHVPAWCAHAVPVAGPHASCCRCRVLAAAAGPAGWV